MDKSQRKPVSEETQKKKRKRRKEQEKDEKSRKPTKLSGKKGSNKQKATQVVFSNPGEVQDTVDAKPIIRASSGSSSDCLKPDRKVQKYGSSAESLDKDTRGEAAGKVEQTQSVQEKSGEECVRVESLRWCHTCSDEEGERRRLEDYKEKRRERYMKQLEEQRTLWAAQKLISRPDTVGSQVHYVVPTLSTQAT